MSYTNPRRMTGPTPKVCQHCYDRTAKGRYVKLTYKIQAWFCNRCAEKFEEKK